MGQVNVWTQHPELVDRLRELYAEGLSSSRIARMLGFGLTRNSIIGKATRLGLQPRAPNNGHTRIQKKQPDMSSARPIKKPPLELKPLDQAPEPAVDEDGKPITVENVKDHHCRYVYGDVRNGDFRYCGRKVKRKAKFCDFHEPHCHQPAHPPRATPEKAA